MNDYMKIEVNNITLLVNTFMQRLEYAALQDDEKISAKEAKILKHVQKASRRFLKDLNKSFN